jgi:peptidoglycan/LPS O-acetylase OafA/YrhL
MKQHEISLKDSNSMRGVAILFIVLHNLIHHIVPVKENEFAYTGSFFQEFMDSLWNGDSFLMNVFSFLGWYGVVIFLFLSGYGLVKKYEGNVQEVSFWVFTKHMYLKLFTLMLIPYLLYILIEYVVHKGSVTYEAFIYHISFLSNLWPQEISPGVYWYLGLIMQLYICYYLL